VQLICDLPQAQVVNHASRQRLQDRRKSCSSCFTL